MAITQIGSALVKRAVGMDGGRPQHLELPAWSVLVFALNFIVFLPLIAVLNYTFEQVYPVLAIVEDENPPAYEPLPLHDSLPEDATAPGSKPAPDGSRAVTSSFRGIHRLLKASGGFRAYFRGLFCLLAQTFLTSVLMGIFSAALGGPFTPIATLLAALALVQFSTAWVHIVISTPSQLHFWQRLPPFKRTFDATWKPVTLYWFAAELNRWIPYAVAVLVNLEMPQVRMGQPIEVPKDNDAWKIAVLSIISLVSSVLITIPAHVILVRVQASLLPEVEDPILPFDRSFRGKVEPAIVGGKGYATIRDAWSTFSKAAWRRLVILYLKIYAVCTAGGLLMALVIIPEFFLLAASSEKKGAN